MEKLKIIPVLFISLLIVMISMAPTYYYDNLSMTSNYIIFVIEITILIPVLIYLFKKTSKNSNLTLHITKPSFKLLLLDILVTTILITLDIAIATFLPDVDDSSTNTLFHMLNTRYKYLNLLNTNIISPITEELIIRGITFALLKRYIKNDTVLIILVSVFFGFLHGISISIITIMLFGAYSQIILIKTKNMSNCCTAHILNNIITTIVNFIFM